MIQFVICFPKRTSLETVYKLKLNHFMGNDGPEREQSGGSIRLKVFLCDLKSRESSSRKVGRDDYLVYEYCIYILVETGVLYDGTR